MSFHYALVDDLISLEEFERRVEEKEKETGGLLDAHTAAMLVVGELGRSHVKIRDITRKASICSFFGKVIHTDPLREFNRADGSPGVLARVTLGDETGQIVALLWDERAMAAQEISPDEVVEVIGRPSRSGALEVSVLNIRPSACEIGTVTGSSSRERDEILGPRDLCLLGLEAPREYTRRDGTIATRVEGLVGDRGGTYRLICWAPELLAGLEAPKTVRITGLRCRDGPRGREYHLDARGRIEVTADMVEVPFTPLSEVTEGAIPALKGTLIVLDPPRSFRKNEEVSWMRRGVLEEGGARIRILLWGDKARIPLLEGESVAIYHVQVKAGRGTPFEIHTQRETVLFPLPAPAREQVVEGTILPGPGGTRIDTGEEAYLLMGELPVASHLRVEGHLEGRRLLPLQYEVARPDRQRLLDRLLAL